MRQRLRLRAEGRYPWAAFSRKRNSNAGAALRKAPLVPRFGDELGDPPPPRRRCGAPSILTLRQGGHSGPCGGLGIQATLRARVPPLPFAHLAPRAAYFPRGIGDVLNFTRDAPGNMQSLEVRDMRGLPPTKASAEETSRKREGQPCE